MKAGTEEILYEAVKAGWLEIRPDGSVWRIAQRRRSRWDGTVKVAAVTPHRIDRAAGGYRTVKLMVDGKQTTTGAHRLVFRHFHGPIPPGLTINHRNGQKADNSPSNLELADYSDQATHALRVLKVGRVDQWGERNAMAKLTTTQVLEIRSRRQRGERLSSIAADFGIAFQTVSKIARGDRRARCGDERAA